MYEGSSADLAIVFNILCALPSFHLPYSPVIKVFLSR